jgi:outer membrane protein assembly factor BamB
MPLFMALICFVAFKVESLTQYEADSLFEAGLMEYRFYRNIAKASEIFKKIVDSRNIETHLLEAARRSLEMCKSEKPYLSTPSVLQLTADTGHNLLMFHDKNVAGLISIINCGADAIIVFSNGLIIKMSSAGKHIWSKTLPAVPVNVESDGNSLCVVESANVLAVYDATDGKLRWKTRFYSSISSVNIASRTGTVAVLLRNGRLNYCQADDGTLLWSVSVPRGNDMKIRAANSRFIVVADGSRNSHTISTYDGEPIWSLSTHQIKSSYLIDDNFILVGSTVIQCLELATGKQKWLYSANSAISSTLSDNASYIATVDFEGKMHIIDALFGTIRNTFPAELGTIAAFYHDRVVCVDIKGRFHSWNTTGRSIWKYSVAESEKIVYAQLSSSIAVYTENNGLIFLNPYNRMESDRRAISGLKRAEQYKRTGMNELALKLAQTVLEEVEPGNTYAAAFVASIYQKTNDREKAFFFWDYALRHGEKKVFTDIKAFDDLNKLSSSTWCFYEPTAMKFSSLRTIGKFLSIPCYGSISLLDINSGKQKIPSVNYSGRQIYRTAPLGTSSMLIHVESDIIAYDIVNMKQLWKVDTKVGITSFHASERYVWAGTWEAGVAAFDAKTGKIAGRFMMKSKGVHVTDFGRKTFCIGLDGSLSSFHDNNELFRSRSREPYLAVFAPMSDIQALAAATSDGSIEAININDGTLLWKIPSGAQAIGFAYVNGFLTALLADGRIIMISSTEGRVLWELRPVEQPPELIVSIKETIVTAGDNRIVFLRLSDGRMLRELHTPGRVASFTAEGNMLYVRLENGLVSGYNLPEVVKLEK